MTHLRGSDQGGWRRAENRTIQNQRRADSGPESKCELYTAEVGVGVGVRPLPSVAPVQSVQAQALVPALSLEHFLCVPLEPHRRQRITLNKLQQTNKQEPIRCRFLCAPVPPPLSLAAVLLPARTRSQRSGLGRRCRGIRQRHSACKPPAGPNRRLPPSPMMHLCKEKKKKPFRCYVAASEVLLLLRGDDTSLGCKCPCGASPPGSSPCCYTAYI